MPISSQLKDIEWNVVGDEVITYLRNLLRLDTRNPPGNETLAAEYLRGVLEREGIACEIVGPGPNRGTIVGRLKGDGSAPPLLLMSHTDVVAVEPEKWTHDPFAAEIDDGFIYGRGALDMKHMVTMELMTMLLLKRASVPLKRDVIFMAAVGRPPQAGTASDDTEHHCTNNAAGRLPDQCDSLGSGGVPGRSHRAWLDERDVSRRNTGNFR
jgi:peptidase M20/M25/M40-like protein